MFATYFDFSDFYLQQEYMYIYTQISNVHTNFTSKHLHLESTPPVI